MKPFSEAPVKPDVPDTSDLPETTADRPRESEDWQGSIELPEDSCGWVDGIELPDDSGGWQDDINEPSTTFAVSEAADTSQENDEAQSNPCEKTVDGEKYYYDSCGNLYRVDDQLLPNSTNEINGYTYKTDELGRIISAEGKLHLKDDRDKLKIRDSMEVVGKGDQRDSDDRGHLIGDQFDGSNGLENLVPQDSNINRVDFKNFENALAKEVRAGNDVQVKVEPIYDSDSRRPNAILVTYAINGNENIRIFPND